MVKKSILLVGLLSLSACDGGSSDGAFEFTAEGTQCEAGGLQFQVVPQNTPPSAAMFALSVAEYHYDLVQYVDYGKQGRLTLELESPIVPGYPHFENSWFDAQGNVRAGLPLTVNVGEGSVVSPAYPDGDLKYGIAGRQWIAFESATGAKGTGTGTLVVTHLIGATAEAGQFGLS